MAMYQKMTESIEITVKTSYLEEQSTPVDDHFVWAYHVRIENFGGDTVQLRNRYWRITDAIGRVQEVRGPGVVGEQPVIAPGESYEYTSGCPLPTPFGSMEGTYQLVTENGVEFDARIGEFMLREPGAIH